MKVELNIGLGNNPFDGSAAALLTFNVLTKHGATNTAFRLSKGEYVGSGEDNIVAIFDWDVEHEVGFQTLLEALATIMTQECIAFYVQDWSDGGLTFAPEHDGERYDFDLQYFERWEQPASKIKADDVYKVANDLNIAIKGTEVRQVLDLYNDEEANDPTATWELIVENLIYNVKSLDSAKG